MSSDHFTAVAGQYAAFRPSYPDELFDWLASIAPQRKLAWDCGAGSGQATAALASRFERVLGYGHQRRATGFRPRAGQRRISRGASRDQRPA